MERRRAERLAQVAVVDRAAVDKAVVVGQDSKVAADLDSMAAVVAADKDCLDHKDKAAEDNILDIVVVDIVEDIEMSLEVV